MEEYISKTDNKTYEIDYGEKADPSLSQITITLDPKNKIEVEAILKRMGYDPYVVVYALFKYIQRHERLPFVLNVEELFNGVETKTESAASKNKTAASRPAPYTPPAPRQYSKKEHSFSWNGLFVILIAALVIFTILCKVLFI